MFSEPYKIKNKFWRRTALTISLAYGVLFALFILAVGPFFCEKGYQKGVAEILEMFSLWWDNYCKLWDFEEQI